MLALGKRVPSGPPTCGAGTWYAGPGPVVNQGAPDSSEFDLFSPGGTRVPEGQMPRSGSVSSRSQRLSLPTRTALDGSPFEFLLMTPSLRRIFAVAAFAQPLTWISSPALFPGQTPRVRSCRALPSRRLREPRSATVQRGRSSRTTGLLKSPAVDERGCGLGPGSRPGQINPTQVQDRRTPRPLWYRKDMRCNATAVGTHFPDCGGRLRPQLARPTLGAQRPGIVSGDFPGGRGLQSCRRTALPGGSLGWRLRRQRPTVKY